MAVHGPFSVLNVLLDDVPLPLMNRTPLASRRCGSAWPAAVERPPRRIVSRVRPGDRHRRKRRHSAGQGTGVANLCCFVEVSNG